MQQRILQPEIPEQGHLELVHLVLECFAPVGSGPVALVLVDSGRTHLELAHFAPADSERETLGLADSG